MELDSNTLFIGEVVAAYANEGAFDGQFIDIERVRQVYQIGGENFTTLSGKKLKFER
jgi:flavin reductase (DIM6/NTAB) family NADH-FMN oxidoreductase RutF